MTRKASANPRYSPGGTSASFAAGFADEVRLDARRAEHHPLAISADRAPMAAFAIQATDQETTHSREGDFMPTAARSGHALLKRSTTKNNPGQIAAFNCANRGLVWTTEHFALMGPVSARLG